MLNQCSPVASPLSLEPPLRGWRGSCAAGGFLCREHGSAGAPCRWLPVVPDALPWSSPPLPARRGAFQRAVQQPSRGWDPRLPPRSQGTFPPGQDWGWPRILQHPHLRPGRTRGAQLQEEPASAPMTLIFPSAAVTALRGVPNKAAKTLLSPRERLPGFPGRTPASRASRILLGGAPRFGSVTPSVRGVFGPGRAGVRHPGVRAGCACPGRSRCGSAASGGYYAGC